MPTFSLEVREIIWKRTYYTCECRCKKCLGNQNLSVHHRVPNTKVNRRIYGNTKIQSAANGALLCGFCHTNCKSGFKGFKEGEMNQNQDIIDIIQLNKLEDMNENSLLPEDEKKFNKIVIKRNRQEKMNRVRLQLTPEQVAEAKKQERASEDSVISEEDLGKVKRTEIKE